MPPNTVYNKVSCMICLFLYVSPPLFCYIYWKFMYYSCHFMLYVSEIYEFISFIWLTFRRMGACP